MKNTLFLTVGTNFDHAQIDHFAALNEKYSDVKITSVYGSLCTNEVDLVSARPDFRLGKADRKAMEAYIIAANDYGISIDYAANGMLSTSVQELHDKRQYIVDQLKYLESVGIKRIIASNPLLMEIISEHTSLAIKASTILGVNNVNAIKHYAKYNVNSICTDIYINRNIPLLAAMQAEGVKYGVEMELLANEICFFGDVPCNNMLRANCYIHSSMGGNEKQLFDAWPFGRCQKARKEHPESMLKIPFILPCHLDYYGEHTGITHFKISGRTNTFEYLSRTVESYMQKHFEGPIEQLFMLPQNIQTANADCITFEKLKNAGYFEKILNKQKGCAYQCHSCHYCDRLYEKLRSK